VEQLLEISGTTIAQLLQRLEHNSEVSMGAVQGMETVSAELHKLTAALVEVDKIAFGNKLLALNAKIQAVHVGDQGNAFGRVADEISIQAYRSTDLAGEMSQAIQRVSQAVTSAAGDLHDMAAADKANLALSRQEADLALSGLRTAHERAEGSLATLTEQNSRLTGMISGAIVSLQFQDRVKQQLEHACAAIDQAARALGRHFSDSEARLDSSQAAASLRQAHTMEDERGVLARVAGETARRSGESNVELF
jgi:methyl-accepting chemotaxis protein